MTASDQELVGRVVAGKYRLERLVARGGFSSVFRGLHMGIDRPVAIKVLPLSDDVQATWIERFSREAKVVSQLTHPNTITIFDFGREGDDFFYLIMEFVRGRSLSRYVKKFGPVPPDRLARFAMQIARSLDEAHHMGIVHRDLKPSNIMVSIASSGEETIKVLDFGVAKLLDPVPDVDIQLTQVGAFVGTPRYASPEQLRREQLDHRSDIYGLGMIMWEALTGEPAVDATDYGSCIQYHLGPDPWRLPPGFDVPPGLAEIVHKALEKDRANRYISCGQMADALEAFLGNYHYGDTMRMDIETAMTLERLEESQELQAIMPESISADSAVEEIRPRTPASRELPLGDAESLDEDISEVFGLEVDAPRSNDRETIRTNTAEQRETVRTSTSNYRETAKVEPVSAADDFMSLAESFDPNADDEGPEFLSGPAMSSEGRTVPPRDVPREAPEQRKPTRMQDEERRAKLARAARADWDDDLGGDPLAEDPRVAREAAARATREPSIHGPDRRPEGIPESAKTKIIGGVTVIILIVVASIIAVNLTGGEADGPAGNEFEEMAEAQVEKLLAEADQPKAAPSDGTPTISPKALLIALNHDGWKSSDQTENDLGDLKQVSMMVRKEEMAASVTIYSTRSANIAEELLADTRSPAEGITFGSTMVRVAPGPSSAKNGVTPVIAALYQFKNIVREEAGK